MNNQLQKTNGNVPAVISPNTIKAMENMFPAERKIIEAALEPKLRTVDPLEAQETLIDVLTVAYTIAGQSADGPTLALYALELHEKLMGTYPDVTLEEIRIAIKAGVYGEAGEYFGLNPKTLFGFIKHYLKSPERTEARKVFEEKRLMLAATKQLTQEERTKSNKEFVNMLYADFLADKLKTDYIPAFLYDLLEEQGLIKLTREEKNTYLENGRAYYRRLAASSRYAGQVFNVTVNMETEHPEITARTIAKQFVVWDFFVKHKNSGEETIFTEPLKLPSTEN